MGIGKILGESLLIILLATPLAQAACSSQPKSITAKIFSSSDGVAVPTSSNTLVSAGRSGVFANSTSIDGNGYFFYDAGTAWGNWCEGDVIQVNISTSTGQGTYTTTSTKALTTENPEIFPNSTLQPPSDTTPPGPVTGLTNTTYASDRITWSWTNPTNSDFGKVMVLLDSVFKTNTTGTSYEATLLNATTAYTISVKSVDTTGNIGSPVNHTATTAPVVPSPTPTPTPPPAAPQGGGPQGGGGPAGGGSTPPPAAPPEPPPAPVAEEARVDLPPIAAGAAAAVVLPATPVQEIAVEAARSIRESVRVTAQQFSSQPSTVSSAPAGKSYVYLSIEAPGLDPRDVAKATLKAKVERAWAEAGKIAPDSLLVQRYTTAWTPLPTRVESQDDRFVYLKAESPGFSIFAITGEEGSAVKPGLVPAVPSATPTPQAVYLPPVGGTAPPAKSPGFEVLASVLALAGAWVLYRRR